MDNTNFSELGLSEEILKAVMDIGFEESTPIQKQTIPLILKGRDVIGHSHTGTGKTAAFGIPVLEMVDIEDKKLQVLILCPTRELAIQACEEIRRFAKYKHGIKVVPIYGGQQIDRQIRALKQGAQVVIGTPGRVMDHMRRKTLKTENVKIMVLDEADEMLNMGFREDIEVILKDIPEKRQTILFSATMSNEILRITKLYQKNPELVKVIHKQLTVPNTKQYYYEVRREKKIEAFCRLVDINNAKLSLVFCNTKRKVDELVNQLQIRGYLVDGIHGDMKQNARTKVMDMFKNRKIDILIATDVAARGIDVEDVEAVYNFDFPQDEEYYVHRIGRTGRAGRIGSSYSFVSGRKELYALKDVQRYTNSKIIFQKIPTVSEVEEIKINQYTEEIKKELEIGGFDKYLKIVEQLMEDDYTSVDIAAAVIKIMTKENLDETINEKEDSNYFEEDNEMVRLFINIGKRDKVRAGDIVGAIANETSIKGKVIGAIDVYGEYTFVDVPKEHAREVMAVMKNVQIKGKRINIEMAKSKKKKK